MAAHNHLAPFVKNAGVLDFVRENPALTGATLGGAAGAGIGAYADGYEGALKGGLGGLGLGGLLGAGIGALDGGQQSAPTGPDDQQIKAMVAEQIKEQRYQEAFDAWARGNVYDTVGNPAPRRYQFGL